MVIYRTGRPTTRSRDADSRGIMQNRRLYQLPILPAERGEAPRETPTAGRLGDLLRNPGPVEVDSPRRESGNGPEAAEAHEARRPAPGLGDDAVACRG